ncbi:MarR family winged helix-turn-helix transcriptional regulator [Enterococcus sp. DIV0876]|uniref:MarR family winged helix-turn-helix transcriptional regulator n=1 Tax=Enterococcus sp. DIV0876 TaxID=2774633 RepID=UPI003D2FE0D1
MSTTTDDLMKQLRFISEASNAFMSQRKQRLTGQQRVLAILTLEDGLVQNHLAEVLDLRPSSMAELLKKMENNGEIERKEDSEDKRSKRIYLTDTGRKKADALTAQKEAASSETFFSGLNEEEQASFAKLLEKIAAGWETDFQQQTERFVDPMDRFQAMQGMREAMMEQWGGNWQEMSHEERRAMKKQIKEAMRQMPFHGRPGMRGGHPFGRNQDCRPGWEKHPFFKGQPFDFDQKAPNRDTDHSSQDEWQDF